MTHPTQPMPRGLPRWLRLTLVFFSAFGLAYGGVTLARAASVETGVSSHIGASTSETHR